jgi:gliding motility-associated-like protein
LYLSYICFLFKITSLKMNSLIKRIVLWCFSSFLFCTLNAQLVNVWKLGNGAGLDFSTTPPTPLANSGQNSLEATASVCDYAGNLLFFTNANSVRNRNNVLMPNGSGLSSAGSATQTMIVPKPGSCSQYYIFQTADHTQNGQLRYSLVDMCLNNGFGDVVVAQKNVFLSNITSEKVTATLHANGTDYWVITHELSTNNFKVYPVTAAGVGLPVVSAVGSVHASNCMIGPIKISANGQRLAVLNSFCSLVELFNFNPATGVVSNPVNISSFLPNGGNGYYGAEFSPNGLYLYLTCTWINNSVYQYELATNTFTQLTPIVSGNYIYGGLQLGPDGKIYMARNNSVWMGVIDQPNVQGTGCNFFLNGIMLAPGTTCTMGIPNFIPSQLFSNPALNNLPVNLGADTAVACNQPFQLLLDAGSYCGADYLWQNGSTAQTLTVTQPGTYWVEVLADCGIGRDTIVISTASAPPAVTLNGPATGCSGQSVVLSATGATSYFWPAGQMLSGNAGNSVVATVQSATTTYTVIGTNACGNDTAVFTLNVTPTPVVVAPDDTIVCPGTPVVLTASGSGQFQWSGGDTSSLQTITVTPATTTNYIVTVTDNGCTSLPDTTILATLVVPPVVVSAPVSICAGQSVTLTASGGSSYAWPPGQGLSSDTGAVVTATPASTTSYTVIGNTTCGADTTLITVVVNPIPVVAAPPDTAVCAGSTLSLTAAGTGSFSWWGDAVSALQTLVVNPPQASVYYVTVTQNGCTSLPDTVNVAMVSPPPVILSGPASVCAGDTVVLLATGGSAYSWPAGQGLSASSGASVYAVPAATTTYTVIGTGICGADTATFAALVNQLPVVAAPNDTTVCTLTTFTLTATGTGNFQWSGGASATQQTISVSPAITTQYIVTVTDSVCTSLADTVTVFTDTLPAAVLSGTPVICAGQTVSLTASGTPLYVWPAGQGLSSVSGNSATASPTATTTYTVIGVNTCGGDTALFNVTVNPTPTVVAPNDTLVCSGLPVTLTAQGSGVFEWSGGTSQSQQVIVVSPVVNTVYYVNVTVNGCTSLMDSVLVSVAPQVQGSISGGAPVCPGDSVLLIAAGGLQYTWINPPNQFAASVWVAPVSNTTYQVAVSNGVCPADTVSIAVSVGIPATAFFQVEHEPCSREIKLVNNSSGANTVLWLFGDGGTSEALNPNHIYTHSDSFLITLVVNPGSNCSDTSSQVYSFLSADKADIWIPNAFTPNGDGLNDVFVPAGPVDCYYRRLLIFNRWGELVWETNNPSGDFWTGKQGTTPVKGDVYVWRLEGDDHVRMGSVTVIR